MVDWLGKNVVRMNALSSFSGEERKEVGVYKMPLHEQTRSKTAMEVL